MKLSEVKYKRCQRCAKFGIKTWYPLADAVFEGAKHIHNGEYVAVQHEMCNPCKRNKRAFDAREKANPAAIERHWKL